MLFVKNVFATLTGPFWWSFSEGWEASRIPLKFGPVRLNMCLLTSSVGGGGAGNKKARSGTPTWKNTSRGSVHPISRRAHIEWHRRGGGCASPPHIASSVEWPAKSVLYYLFCLTGLFGGRFQKDGRYYEKRKARRPGKARHLMNGLAPPPHRGATQNVSLRLTNRTCSCRSWLRWFDSPDYSSLGPKSGSNFDQCLSKVSFLFVLPIDRESPL